MLGAHAACLAGWQERVAAPVEAQTRHVLALTAALAGPLLSLVGEASGGFNFVGHSSTGKTTALDVGASVYGPPSQVIESWRATDNGLEATAEARNDLLLPLDELGEIDPLVLDRAVYMLGNGAGKRRAQVDGSGRPRRVWRLMILSTGELGVAERLSSAGVKPRAGQAVRLSDIPHPMAGLGIFDEVPPGVGAGAFAEQLRAATRDEHGVIGARWLERLSARASEDGAGFRKLLSSRLEHALRAFEAHDLMPEERRVARRFALCAVAGELAVTEGLLPWSAATPMRAAEACFVAWLLAHGGDLRRARREVPRALDACVALNRHAFELREPRDVGGDHRLPHRRLFYEQQGATAVLHIPTTMFRDEVLGEFEHNMAIAALSVAGHAAEWDVRARHRGTQMRCVRVTVPLSLLGVAAAE